MRLSLNRLRIQGFKSITDAELDLTGIGLHFLKGDNQVEPQLASNGAAKSSIWDALTWCLYGKTVSGLKGTDIRPWQGGRTLVSLQFQIDDVPHVLIRELDPSRLTLDGSDCGPEHVVGLIQIPFAVFAHTVLLGQSQPLFLDLKPSAQMELLGDVLPLDRWDSYSTRAADQTAHVQSQLDALIIELGSLQARQAEAARVLTATEEKRDQWASEGRIAGQKAGEALQTTKKALSALLDERAGHDLALDGAETELRADQERLNGLQATLAGATRKIDQQRALWQERDRLNDEALVLSEATICPTCGQHATAGHFSRRTVAIGERLRQMPLENVALLEDELLAVQQQYDRTKTSAATFMTKARKARQALDYLMPEIARLEAKAVSLQQQIIEREGTINPHREAALQLKRRVKDFELDCADVQTEINTIEKQLSRVKFWVKGFKDVRLMLIEEFLDELEIAINDMLPDIGLIDWSVGLEVETETKAGTVKRGLNVTIQSPNNKQPVRWECWSGGEKQRLRLISALALAEVLLNHAGVNPSIIVLDEPTASLSTDSVPVLCEYLANRARDLEKAIWFIDHHAIESSLFTSVTVITKTNAGSVIA